MYLSPRYKSKQSVLELATYLHAVFTTNTFTSKSEYRCYFQLSVNSLVSDYHRKPREATTRAAFLLPLCPPCTSRKIWDCRSSEIVFNAIQEVKSCLQTVIFTNLFFLFWWAGGGNPKQHVVCDMLQEVIGSSCYWLHSYHNHATKELLQGWMCTQQKILG